MGMEAPADPVCLNSSADVLMEPSLRWRSLFNWGLADMDVCLRSCALIRVNDWLLADAEIFRSELRCAQNAEPCKHL